MATDRTSEGRIIKARANLLLDQPFFGALALRLIPQPADWAEGMVVDGRRLYYSPEYVATAKSEELKAGIAQGVMHCALGHPFRRGQRHRRTWNDAGDHVINLALKDAGMAIPDDWLADPTYRGQSTEQVYAALDRHQGGRGGGGLGGNGQGQGTQAPDGRDVPGHGGGAGVMDPQAPQGEGERQPTPAELKDMEREWQEAISQAEFTSTCHGHTPGDSIERIRDARRPKADWRALLREWLTAMARDQYTWSRPNRRHIGDGLYLPSVYSESCPPLVLAIDTSGSISTALLEQFAGELNAILEDLHPEKVTIIYCDAMVNRVSECLPEDLPIELEACGRGGTSFDPVFEWVNENIHEPIAGLVYLTDMYARQVDPSLSPDYPVMWADYGQSTFTGHSEHWRQSFGEQVVLTDAD